jgi:hypothetical protein
LRINETGVPSRRALVKKDAAEKRRMVSDVLAEERADKSAERSLNRLELLWKNPGD